jgi:hypothetical protein
MQPMLHDRGSDGRDVVHLATYHPGRGRLAQVGASPAARGRNMIDDLVRIGDQP